MIKSEKQRTRTDTQLTNGLSPKPSFVYLKYCKLKVHLLQPVEQISKAKLKHPQNTHINLQLSKIIQYETHFMIKC